jgi:hypothetical protein
MGTSLPNPVLGTNSLWYPPQAGCSTDPCREIEIDVRIAQAIEFSLEVVAD